ncbi:hypothetical protein [Rhodovulum sp. MB263]|uniref:hypothetical protein n=1 Tax=Rhodovulum sp. (strain MB263) TaxID=308754 RepID=UPI0009B78CD7|nr:hypothetical protein [Rhodovulum sp. MB263]ARC88189.1 hypothetical protein B5V46_05990 [Rhodovulum sp. MB263]
MAAGSAGAIRRQQVETAELIELRGENRRLKEEGDAMRTGEQASGMRSSEPVTAFRALGGEAMKDKLAFIADHLGEHGVGLIWQVLSASTSWFPPWCAAAPKRALRHAARDSLLPGICAIFEALRGRYRAPRGCLCPPLVRAAMASGIGQQGAVGRVPRTTASRHNLGIAPNLPKRNIRAAEPDRIWLADISEVPADEGWLYLVGVEDMAGMKIVGGRCQSS